MGPPIELLDVVRRSLGDAETGWSMGSFGALAEFHQDRDESPVVDKPDRLTRATARGGIRIEGPICAEVVPIAYEIPSSKPHRWSHGIALCLAAEDARLNSRSVLTELGADETAIRSTDASSILFDMGLNLSQCDFCVRTSDPELVSALRVGEGRSVFQLDNPAMSTILRKHPNRVVLTKLGRVEVYQNIGGPDTGGVSPPGPHTHVLPTLLRSNRTHSANLPIPDGLTPCGYLHPANPVIGPLGEDRNFDFELHSAFQELLRAFGPIELLETKNLVIHSVESGLEPRAFAVPNGRHHRAAVRIALRQLLRIRKARKTSMDEQISRWREVFELTLGPDAGYGIGEYD